MMTVRQTVSWWPDTGTVTAGAQSQAQLQEAPRVRHSYRRRRWSGSAPGFTVEQHILWYISILCITGQHRAFYTSLSVWLSDWGADLLSPSIFQFAAVFLKGITNFQCGSPVQDRSCDQSVVSQATQVDGGQKVLRLAKQRVFYILEFGEIQILQFDRSTIGDQLSDQEQTSTKLF